MLPMMSRDEQFDHGPVFAPLRLLGLHEIRNAEQVILDAIVVHERRPAVPQRGELRHRPEAGHDVHPEPFRPGCTAPKVNRMSPGQGCRVERRHGDLVCLQLGQSRLETGEVLRVGQHQKIDVLANLRRAVEDAGLPAHEQGPDATPLECRKDLSDRGRGQGCLPWRCTRPASARRGRIAPTEKDSAIPSTRRAIPRTSSRLMLLSAERV